MGVYRVYVCDCGCHFEDFTPKVDNGRGHMRETGCGRLPLSLSLPLSLPLSLSRCVYDV